MARIKIEDKMTDALCKVCEGNPGALNVLMTLLEKVPLIDPRCAFGGLNVILQMDDMGLYGSHIWMLFKDVCGEEIEGVITLFRARQLGHLSTSEFNRIIDEDQPYDWRPLVALIQTDVPEFSA